MSYALHLNKSGTGMASKTACGRNILRTPMAASWDIFKGYSHRCIKCDESKQAELNARRDLDAWTPASDPDAWKAADDALVAAHRAQLTTA